MKLSAHLLIAAMHVAATAYEGLTGQSHVQRLVRRKVSNLVRGESRRSWQDGRVNKLKVRAPTPSHAECRRLNREAARSI